MQEVLDDLELLKDRCAKIGTKESLATASILCTLIGTLKAGRVTVMLRATTQVAKDELAYVKAIAESN